MITLVQNDPEVPAGSIGELLRIYRITSRTVRVFAGEELPAPCASSGVIVLGGSMGVRDVERFPFLVEVMSYIRAVAALDIPFLGICLGGQLLAAALGATVHSGSHGEKGVCPLFLLDPAFDDQLFTGLQTEPLTFQWHDDSFDLPKGATLLASSAACPNQAFRFGRHLYGLQFHPEVDREIVAAWSRGTTGEEASRLILEEFVRTEEIYRAFSRGLLENFLRLSGLLRCA